MSIHHLRKCCARPITSADILLEDAHQDKLPTDPQARADFGFDRCQNKNEEILLFGLYQGLVKVLEVRSVTLHRWRERDMLVDEITEKFQSVPEGRRGGYYPWFATNKERIFPPAGTEHPVHGIQGQNLLLMLEKCRDRLQGEDQHCNLTKLAPPAKNFCFLFFALLMQNIRPNPTIEPTAYLWYEFGFATCQDEHDESSLAGLYLSLLDPGGSKRRYYELFGENIPTQTTYPACTFDEFWRSWSSRGLADLFTKYLGNHWWETSHHNFYRFLRYRHDEERPSIWRLKHLLALEAHIPLSHFPETQEAVQEYGFTPRMDTRVKVELREFYKRLLSVKDPQRVHDAKVQGKLFSYSQTLLGQYSEDISSLIQRLDMESHCRGSR